MLYLKKNSPDLRRGLWPGHVGWRSFTKSTNSEAKAARAHDERSLAPTYGVYWNANRNRKVIVIYWVCIKQWCCVSGREQSPAPAPPRGRRCAICKCRLPYWPHYCSAHLLFALTKRSRSYACNLWLPRSPRAPRPAPPRSRPATRAAAAETVPLGAETSASSLQKKYLFHVSFIHSLGQRE